MVVVQWMAGKGATMTATARTPLNFTARVLLGAMIITGLFMTEPHVAAARYQAPMPFIDAGTISEVVDYGPTDLDPASNTSDIGADIDRNLDGTLIALAGSSMTRFQPELATSWSANAAGSVYIFHLRRGVRFHTGRCCMT